MKDLKQQIIIDDSENFTASGGESSPESPSLPCKPTTIFPDNVSFTPDELEIVEPFNLRGRIDFDNEDFIPDEQAKPAQVIKPAIIFKEPKFK
jgi:hypothetical protein